MNNPRFKMQIRRILFMVYGLWFIASLTGCEAFARKFTRKPKEIKREEQVLQPQEYPDAALDKEDLYKDYFLFWETWSSELLNFLKEDANAKKQKECASEALDNLSKMQSMLNPEKASSLAVLMDEFTTFKNILFENRLNKADLSYLRNKLERIKSRAHRGFIFSKIKKDLK